MKKRWTFELIVDTGFLNSKGTMPMYGRMNSSRQLELQSNDEATKQVMHWLEGLFKNEPLEFELKKFEARNVE